MQEQGKKVLTKVLYGGAPPPSLQENSFLQQLAKVSLYLRWLAVTLLPDEYDTVKNDQSKKNPEASLLSYLYMSFEDLILSVWSEFIHSKNPGHMSLHFDGVRVSRIPGWTVDDLCAACEAHILTSTGFKVAIREKRHRTVLQLLEMAGYDSQELGFEASDTLRNSGNCIPAAIAALTGTAADVRTLLAQDSEENSFMQARGSRSYSQCQKMLGYCLGPFLSFDALKPGKYLLHSEHTGKPHCIGFEVSAADKASVQVYDTEKSFTLRQMDFFASLHSGLDSATVVCFKLGKAKDDLEYEEGLQPEDIETLLDLQAAGKMVEVSSDDDQAALEIKVIDVLSDSDTEPVDRCWLDDQANVTVDAALLSDLETEVISLVKEGRYDRTRQGYRCPACPWRCFQRPKRVQEHLQKYHTPKHQFCCSGTKQMKVILSMHDSDMLCNFRKGQYLRRSAELLRRQVQPQLPPSINSVDTSLRLLLSAEGSIAIVRDYRLNLSVRKLKKD